MHRGALLGRWFAAACAISLAATIALNAAPALHYSVHDDGSGPLHQCAVTLLQSGSWGDHAEPLATSPGHDTPCVSTVALDVVHLRVTHHDFAALEHAPPTFS